jgi:hypothetical protein
MERTGLDPERAEAIRQEVARNIADEAMPAPTSEEVAAATPQTRRPRKKKESNSRTARWSRACLAAREAFDKMCAARDDFQSAISEVKSIQEEFEEWKDNLPENLQQSPLGEKLETVCGIDLEPGEDDWSAMETAIDEAEAADLPLGFGRD